jgi:hypothetical protein
MNKLTRVAAVVALIIGCGAVSAASAAVVTMDARYYGGGVPGATSADYVAAWAAALAANPNPGNGYYDQTIANWNGSESNAIDGGSDTDLAYHDEVTFDVTQAGTYSFKFGIDFGYGGTLLVNGAAIDTNTNNLWWSGNINDQNNTLFGTASLHTGLNTIDIYGFEDCCDGGTIGEYAGADTNGAFVTFAVPEPADWALMILGLGGVGATLRAARRKTATAPAIV